MALSFPRRLGMFIAAYAQSDLENAIRFYGEENIGGYIQPLADLYGADINAGFFHSAAIPAEGFHFSIDFIGAGAIVSDDDKTYSAKLPLGFEQETAEMPTILGPQAQLITDVSGAQFKGSNGVVDAGLFGYGIGQITVGSVMGTEAFFRFLATPELGNGKMPATKLFGGGLRHSVSQYMPEPPLELSVGGAYNVMTIGDIMDITGIIVGAQGSKTWDTFTAYGGAAWEKSTLKLDYTSTGAEPGPVSVELDGRSNFRFTAGGLLKFGVFKIFADANVGSVVSFSGGIGFGN
jgi:hypothetical protein